MGDSNTMVLIIAAIVIFYLFKDSFKCEGFSSPAPSERAIKICQNKCLKEHKGEDLNIYNETKCVTDCHNEMHNFND